MVVEDKLVERKLLLRRSYSRKELFKIGKALTLPYFNRFESCWEIDEDEASLEIASNTNDMQLKDFFERYIPRDWTVFRGKYYTFEDGNLYFEGSWRRIRANIYEAREKYRKNFVALLKFLVETGESRSLKDIQKNFEKGVDPYPILAELERLKVIVTSYVGERYKEWKVLEETLPLFQSELGITSSSTQTPTARLKVEKEDYLSLERQKVEAMED